MELGCAQIIFDFCTTFKNGVSYSSTVQKRFVLKMNEFLNHDLVRFASAMKRFVSLLANSFIVKN